MSNNIFNGFILEEVVAEEIINKYVGKIPEQLIEVWKKYGFGSIINGYLKIINPDRFQNVIDESYFRSQVAIPIFATGMGDIIAWEENKYLRMVNYRRGGFKGISAGFDFFFLDLESTSFCEKYLDCQPYFQAVEKYGQPTFDECFGYTPILGLGGSEKVEKLEKVKLIEHIYI
ncbi:T6SS immunity protein Tdi1 domain-containing protein [Clostridium estertheticum]|uniref:T6SS immunity protein Tdi1 domain-containing protein n=1 Tax=Clostridium estertheticum TaxID=238834 RepID=UPI002161DACD|nr:T6SS immunity protein Tdi1 domain-containing protein [Clostridium estertheticum]